MILMKLSQLADSTARVRVRVPSDLVQTLFFNLDPRHFLALFHGEDERSQEHRKQRPEMEDVCVRFSRFVVLNLSSDAGRPHERRVRLCVQSLGQVRNSRFVCFSCRSSSPSQLSLSPTPYFEVWGMRFMYCHLITPLFASSLVCDEELTTNELSLSVCPGHTANDENDLMILRSFRLRRFALCRPPARLRSLECLS
jgi:hypothetical protein